MLQYTFAGFCALIIVFVMIPAARSFYYMIRDIIWERNNLSKK